MGIDISLERKVPDKKAICELSFWEGPSGIAKFNKEGERK
jgi:hypothetical protein